MCALLAKMNVSLCLPEGNGGSELDSIWLHFAGLMKLSSTDQTDSDLVCGGKVFNPCLSPLRWGGLRGERPLFVRFQDSLCLPRTIRSRHPLWKAGAPQAASSARINCIAALFLSPDNRWGGMASFRIFSFFSPLLNTAAESASPSRFLEISGLAAAREETTAHCCAGDGGEYNQRRHGQRNQTQVQGGLQAEKTGGKSVGFLGDFLWNFKELLPTWVFPFMPGPRFWSMPGRLQSLRHLMMSLFWGCLVPPSRFLAA